MRLDNDVTLLSEAIKATAEYFHIAPVFIEKDYWICRILEQLSECDDAGAVVFKGGTSLSKGYFLINRFSEDIDVAIITGELTGNQIKSLLKKVINDMTEGLEEIEVPEVTSKGSRYRKSLFEYPKLAGSNPEPGGISSRLVVEINSFAHPYPFVKREIKSYITQYMEKMEMEGVLSTYDLKPFTLNVLDKRRTLCEKVVALMRFSCAENPIKALGSKIRHFYDIYYLLEDTECKVYADSRLVQDVKELIGHDKEIFDTPEGWKEFPLQATRLLTDFDSLWNALGTVYERELTLLVYGTLPAREKVGSRFKSFAEFLRAKLQDE